LENAVDADLKSAAQLRQSLLAWTFSSKLVPQDPIDESAIALLECIQEERAGYALPARHGENGRRSIERQAELLCSVRVRMAAKWRPGGSRRAGLKPPGSAK
jgi:hypothetical protein